MEVEEDCGIHPHLVVPSCKCGALDMLATTVKTVNNWVN